MTRLPLISLLLGVLLASKMINGFHLRRRLPEVTEPTYSTFENVSPEKTDENITFLPNDYYQNAPNQLTNEEYQEDGTDDYYLDVSPSDYSEAS